MHFRPLAAMLSLALAFGGMADAHAQSLKKRAPRWADPEPGDIG